MVHIKLVKDNWLNISSTKRGIIWILLSGICFAFLGTSIKMASREIPTLEVVFFRNFLNLLIMLPWLIKIKFKGLKTNKLGTHFLRATAGLISMYFWFAGFAVLPLADATSLAFTAPIFATIGAAIFLSEVVKLRRWCAIMIGFFGVLVILRPGFQLISVEAIFIIIGSIFVALAILLVKNLSQTESPTTMVLFMALFLTPLSLIPALSIWVWPSIEAWYWIIVVGVSATGGHLFFNRSLVVTDMTIVLPFDYFRLIFAALIGLFLFHETPDLFTWVGGSIIFASTVYIANRESQNDR